MPSLKEKLTELIRENTGISINFGGKKKELSPNVKKILHLVPNELRTYLEGLSERPSGSALLNQFQPGQLPLRFAFNTRGGWITPDGKMFIKTLTNQKDAGIRPRVKNIKEYNNDVRLAAFKQGWIRQDWYQPIYSQKFTIVKEAFRKLTFTFDPLIALDNIRNWIDIQNIAKAYTIIMPPGFYYEIALVKYNGDDIKYEVKRFKTLSNFLLELRNIRQGSKAYLKRENYFNNPFEGIGRR